MLSAVVGIGVPRRGRTVDRFTVARVVTFDLISLDVWREQLNRWECAFNLL